MKSIEQRAIWWFINGDTSVSSKVLASVMLGVLSEKNIWQPHPHSVADFRRCQILLELIPEWRPRLHEVAEIHPNWKGFVKNWDELVIAHGEELHIQFAPRLNNRIEEFY